MSECEQARTWLCASNAVQNGVPNYKQQWPQKALTARVLIFLRSLVLLAVVSLVFFLVSTAARLDITISNVEHLISENNYAPFRGNTPRAAATSLQSECRDQENREERDRVWRTVWLGPNDPPPLAKVSINSVFYHHPNSSVVIYHDNPKGLDSFISPFVLAGYRLSVELVDLTEFSKPCYPGWEETPEQYYSWIKGPYFNVGKVRNQYVHRSDLLRSCFVYLLGGTYFDLDNIIVRPLDTKNDIIVSEHDDKSVCNLNYFYYCECSEIHPTKILPLPGGATPSHADRYYTTNSFFSFDGPHASYLRRVLDYSRQINGSADSCWNCMGPRAFSNATAVFVKGHLGADGERLMFMSQESGMCTGWRGQLFKPVPELRRPQILKQLASECYVMHVFEINSNGDIRKHSNNRTTLFDILAANYCVVDCAN